MLEKQNISKGLNISLPGEEFSIHLLNSIPAMVAYLDKDLCYRYMNLAYQKFFGNNILGKQVYSKLKKYIPEALKGKMIHFEDKLCASDFNHLVEFTLTSDLNSDGQIKGYAVFARDITNKRKINEKTEQKNNELYGYCPPQKKLFKSLDASKYYFQELIEKLPVATYTCDSDGRIEMYNSAAVVLWGREPEVGKDMWCGSWRIYKPDGTTLPLESCPMAICLKEGRPIDGEEIIVERPDGKRINVRPYPRPILDASGIVIGAVNMLIDLTESKVSINNNARLVAIVQSSDDAIISKTLQGFVTSWNDAAQRIFGYSASEMIGQPITKLIPPDRIDEEPQILERLKKGERVDHFETKRITKEGKILDISLTISPMKDNDGKITGASKIARDITEQKKLVEALRESEERFRTVADTTPVMIWMSGTDKLCNFFNKRWLEFTGRSLQQELGNGWTECIHPSDRRQCLETYNSSFDVHAQFEMEYRLKRHDGEYRWVYDHGIPRYCSAGTFLGYIGSCTDIHDRKAAREELEKLVAERTTALRLANINLEKSNEELKRFAYVASHDLQEPLRKIQTFGNLISEQNGNELSSKGKNYLDRMIIASNKMQNLIEALLEFSRATNSQENFKETDLNILIDEIKKEFQETIAEKKATVHVESLPKLMVIPFQFKQMLSNIIGNALKYAKVTEDPVIAITSSTINAKDINKEYSEQDRYYFKLTIQDNGIGFEEEHTEIIFELFQRLHGKHEYSGSGIGLAICKKNCRES